MARKKIDEATVSRGYPDDGTGIAGDDDRPPGNIIYGEKYKKVSFLNRLTPYEKIWGLDAGDWKWDEFEHSMGMEDFENYSDTLKGMEKILPQWDDIWKRMKEVPDAVTTARFKQAGQIHRTADDQLGDVPKKDDRHVDLSKNAKSAKVAAESVVDKIERYLV